MKSIFLTLVLLLAFQAGVRAQTLAEHISRYNPAEADYIASLIIASGEKYNIDPILLSAVFCIESGYNNAAVSSAGARGIAQLMPDTAAFIGRNPDIIEENIDGGASYLRDMLDLHYDKGIYQYNFALASYNAGYQRTKTTIPSYTYDYIQAVKDEYDYEKKMITDISSHYVAPASNPTDDELLRKKKMLLKLYQLRKLQLEHK